MSAVMEKGADIECFGEERILDVHHCVTVYKDWQLHTTKNDSNLDTVRSFVMLVPGSR